MIEPLVAREAPLPTLDDLLTRTLASGQGHVALSTPNRMGQVKASAGAQPGLR